MPSSPRRSTAASRCPRTGGAPKGLQSTGNSAFAVPSSLLGIPALTLPLFEIDGMPLGLQVLGFVNEDAARLRALGLAARPARRMSV